MSIKGIFPIDKWDFETESILEDLPKEDLKLLLANQSEQTYKKGEVIFKEGAYAFGIYYILEGKVKKYKVDREGREQIIYVANNGELLGYHAVLSASRYSDYAAALEESQISFIPKDDFIDAVRQSDVLNRRLLKTLSHEFTVMSNTLTMFAQKSVRERLALQLIVLREKYKVNFEPGMPVEINMSRKDLASLAGTARENVARVLSEFKKDGIIATNARKIVVLDVKKLIAIADYKYT
jgi:CRP-like cAMP-binding protein